ncbi:tail fiber assembly protein, partial [Salmonella enterica subsp. enterica]|nr:tail fiber assembly protein [Salmonella enterica subsp. enterica]
SRRLNAVVFGNRRTRPVARHITSVSPDSEYQKWDDKAWIKDESAETAAQFAGWKKYRVPVNRVDASNPA